MELIIPVILTALSTWLAYTIAKEKHLNVKLWVVLALIFGLIVVPFLYLAKSNSNEKDDSGYLEA